MPSWSHALEGFVARHLTTVRRTSGDIPPGSRTVVEDGDFSPSLATVPPAEPWDTVLKACVTGSQDVAGLVDISLFDYEKLRTDSTLRSSLEEYCTSLEAASLRTMNDNEAAAVCLNAYNAFTVRLVVNYIDKKQAQRATKQSGMASANKEGATSSSSSSSSKDAPLLCRSIHDLSTRGVFGRSVWKLPAGFLGELGEVSLDALEHGVLRRHWKSEPRFHACLVCASLSCPNLRAEAFVPHRLCQQMVEQARRWLSNPSKGLAVVERANKRKAVLISRIFLWFAADFADWQGTSSPTTTLSSVAYPNSGVARFIAEYAPPSLVETDDEHGEHTDRQQEVDFFQYNWNLNAALVATRQAEADADAA